MNLLVIKSLALHDFAIFVILTSSFLLNFIWSLFIWGKLKINQPHEKFLSKIKWNSHVEIESSNKHLKFRCLGEQIWFVFNVCLHSKGTNWFQRSIFRGIWNKILLYYCSKLKKPEMVWLWICKYNKIVKHGQSLYLNVEPLSSNSSLWSNNSIHG